MTDPVIISTIILSGLSILGGILLKFHLKKCKCGDAECKCENNDSNNNSTNNSPSLSKKIKKFFSNSTINNNTNNNNN